MDTRAYGTFDMGLPVISHNNFQYRNFSTRVGTIVDRKKALKQAGSSAGLQITVKN